MIYEIGDLARVKATFTNLAGVPTDPTNVNLIVMAPDGTEQTFSALSPDTNGVYHEDINLTQPGTYAYQFKGTGTIQAVIEGTIKVADTLLQRAPVGAVQGPTPIPVASNAVILQAELDTLDRAIATGAMRVRFQDREVTYRSTKDILVARTLVQTQLDTLQGVVRTRQFRVYTDKGWGN